MIRRSMLLTRHACLKIFAGLALLTPALAAASAPAPGPPSVTRTSVRIHPTRTDVVLTTSARARAWCEEWRAGKPLVLNIQASFKAKPFWRSINRGAIAYIKGGPSDSDPALTRIVVARSASPNFRYSLNTSTDRSIVLSVWTGKVPTASAKVPAPRRSVPLPPPSIARAPVTAVPRLAAKPSPAAAIRPDAPRLIPPQPVDVPIPAPSRSAIVEKVLGSQEQIGQDLNAELERVVSDLKKDSLAGLSAPGAASSPGAPQTSAPKAALPAPPVPLRSNPAIQPAAASEKPAQPIPPEPVTAAALPGASPPQPSSSPGPAREARPASEIPELDVYDTDIGVVARTLASQWGENIIVAQDAKAQITARLSGQSLEEILTQITRSNGLDLKHEDGAYMITKAAPAPEPPVGSAGQPSASEDMETAIWQCRYNTATELAASVSKLFPSLTVAPGPVYTAPLLDASAASVDGAQLASTSDSSGSASSLQPGTVLMRGPRAGLKQAMELLRQLDIRRPQVVIEALVTEISDEASRKLGLTWSWSNLEIRETPDSHMRFGTFKRDGMNFEGILEAMDKDGQAKLLARPTLAVVDGGHGSILIGDRIIYPKVIGYSSLNTPIYDKEEEKVGIYLQVAPMITQDGYITMTVYPQVSVVKGFLNIQGSQYPQISTREAKTTVRLKEGEQFAIGGLIRNDEINTLIKVPLLGDLPIIKNLFRHRETSNNRSEIVIFLTPKIIPGETVSSGSVLTNRDTLAQKAGN